MKCVASRWMVCLLAVLVSSALLRAEPEKKPDLEVRLNNPMLRGRTGAAIPVDVTFIWRGGQLVEGQLRLEVLGEDQTLFELITDPLMLSPGEQSYTFMLPSIMTSHPELVSRINVSLLTPDRTIHLGQHTLVVPWHGERSLAVAVCDPWGQNAGGPMRVASTLMFDRFKPKDQKQGIQCLPVRLKPERMPVHAAGYTSYDLVLLSEEGFSQMNSRQLDALARWTRGGGSLCLLAGSGLSERHLRFMDQVMAEQVPEVRAGLDEQGRLMLHGLASPAPIHLLPVGIGRLVLVAEPTDMLSRMESPLWREAAAFLWHVRADQRQSVVMDGAWVVNEASPADDELNDEEYEMLSQAYWTALARSVKAGRQLDYTVQPDLAREDLNESLMPHEVRLIPVWVIVVILLAFVLAIGPGDYFLLGMIRQRKLTWVLFPLMAVLFTLLTILVANRYMGVQSHTRTLKVVDVDALGQPVRISDWTLYFMASQQRLEQEVKNVMCVPFDLQKREYVAPRSRESIWQSAPSPPSYLGRLPGSYTLHQDLRQWQPFMFRRTGFGDAQERDRLGWDQISLAMLRDSSRHDDLMRTLLREEGAGAWVLFYHGDEVTVLTKGPEGEASRMFSELSKVIEGMCVRQEKGLFEVVARVSPTGGSSLEDMALLDPSDQAQWLLVVVEPMENGLRVVRRLYEGGS